MGVLQTINRRRESLSTGILLLAFTVSAFQFAPSEMTSHEGATALEFDGADDRVIVPYNASFPTAVFTAGAWVKLSLPNRRAAIIARGEDDNSWNLSWQLFVSSDGTFQVMLEDSNENNYCYPFNDCAPMGVCSITGDLFVADDTWHHVAVSRDSGANLALYVDGIVQATCTGTGVPSSNNFQDLSIGCMFGTIGPPPGGVEPPTWFLAGQIDEPAMWDRSLSGSEIADVYSGGVNPLDVGLKGYWAFEEGTGQDVQDSSPAGNHGFLGVETSADSADPQWVSTQATDIEDSPIHQNPKAQLQPNYPNPFSTSTSIIFQLTRSQYIRVIVFDLLGNEVTILTEGQRGIGTHEISFDGSDLPSGTYLYRLETENGAETSKMVHVE